MSSSNRCLTPVRETCLKSLGTSSVKLNMEKSESKKQLSHSKWTSHLWDKFHWDLCSNTTTTHPNIWNRAGIHGLFMTVSGFLSRFSGPSGLQHINTASEFQSNEKTFQMHALLLNNTLLQQLLTSWESQVILWCHTHNIQTCLVGFKCHNSSKKCKPLIIYWHTAWNSHPY